jgi:AraC family ethanolamine operon transcriptional activator
MPGECDAATLPTARPLAIRISGPEQLAEIVPGARIEATQLTPGDAIGSLLRADLGGVQLGSVRAEVAVRTSGCLSPHEWTLVVVLDAGRPDAVLWGRPLAGGTLNIYPPGTENDGRYARGFTTAGLVVNPDELAVLVDSVVPELGDLATWRRESHRPTPWRVLPLQRLFRKAIDSLAGTPVLVYGPGWRVMREELLHAYLTMLAEAAKGERHHDRRTWLDAARLVRLAEEYVRHRDDEPILVGELAHACDVPRRTLNRAFHRFLGMGPGAYLRRRRLSLARRELRTAAPGSVTITDVAFRLGFWHLSRFAVEYRRMFGESPSQTLHRQPAPSERSSPFPSTAGSAPRARSGLQQQGEQSLEAAKRLG